MTYPHVHDSARLFPLSKGGAVLEQKRPATVRQHRAGLTSIASKERPLALTRITPGVCPAQEFTDPLVLNARLVNLAAEIERNLATRKALRPRRSDAARKGWEARRGL